MIVICEECGKKYKLNPSKIKGKEATGTCTSCNHKIKVYHPNPELNPSFEMPSPIEAPIEEPIFDDTMALQAPVDIDYNRSESRSPAPERPKMHIAAASSQRRLMGLRGKILLLFFLVPIVLIIAAGYLYTRQLYSLSSIISGESSKVVSSLAEQIIIAKSREVAKEAKLYLDAHPGLRKEDFQKDPRFKDITLQKVGETGYTCVVERETADHPEYMWVHPNEKLLGIDLRPAMKEKMGKNWDRFKAVQSRDHETWGYYLWLDGKEKFTAGIPIEGTPYNIAGTTYIDEFTQPVKDLEKRVGSLTSSTLRIVMIIIGLTTLLVAAIALLYGNKLSSKIRNLTSVADQISVGDMDVEIDQSDKDELGELAQSIARMQDSIRLSIDRLRRRKNRRAA